MKYIILILVLAFLLGCSSTTLSEQRLPTGAKIIENCGNDWHIVEWRGHKYLYHYTYMGGNKSSQFIFEKID